MIALAVQYAKPPLLDTTELREGIAIMAQHIVWGGPQRTGLRLYKRQEQSQNIKQNS